MEGEAEGLKGCPRAEPLCLGSFNFLLGSLGLRLGEGRVEGRQRAQVTFGTEALVTVQVPSSLWPMPPTHPALISPLSHSRSQSARLVVLWALGFTVAFSKVWLVGGGGVGDPGEPWAPSLGGLVYASACLVPWLLVPWPICSVYV